MCPLWVECLIVENSLFVKGLVWKAPQIRSSLRRAAELLIAFTFAPYYFRCPVYNKRVSLAPFFFSKIALLTSMGRIIGLGSARLHLADSPRAHTHARMFDRCSQDPHIAQRKLPKQTWRFESPDISCGASTWIHFKSFFAASMRCINYRDTEFRQRVGTKF